MSGETAPDGRACSSIGARFRHQVRAWHLSQPRERWCLGGGALRAFARWVQQSWALLTGDSEHVGAKLELEIICLFCIPCLSTMRSHGES